MTLWWWASIALGAFFVFVVASYLHYRYWVRRFTLALSYECEDVVPTEDGCAVEVRRLPRVEGRDRTGTPILLVHGLALNHRNHDMREDLSLGRYLALHGRDVWLLTLRSGRDLRWSEERRATFENMARYDLPAGIREILARTGAAQLDYVGFSMGGMLLYAAVGRTIEPALFRKIAIIGSPARIRPPLAILAFVARLVPHWIVPTLRLRIVSRLVAFAADWLATPIHRWVYNPTNVERGVAAHTLVNGFVNIPGKLAAEFVGWAADGGPVRFEQTPVIEGLRRVDRPIFFVAGADDRLAPPSSVKLAYDAWGADCAHVDKAMRIAGLEYGAAADYGHGDLAIGRFAAEDVFDPVREFLEEQAAGAPRTV